MHVMSLHRKRAIVAAASMGIGLLTMATPAPTTPNPDAAGQKMLDSIREHIFQYTPREKPSVSPNNRPKGGLGGQPEAFAGREDLYAAQVFDLLPACVALDADPFELIAQRARQTNVVIINEHHASPLDRQFIGRVLRALRAEGYSIYAAETFTPYDNLSHSDALGFDGWYSNEPIFGRTLRLARMLGYSLVGYEQTQEQEKASATARSDSSRHESREQNQTRNLMTAIFKDRPNAKVVIHVGHSHVNERQGSGSDSKIWMAQLLKATTGRDPLTISQTACKSPVARDVIAQERLTPSGQVEVGSHVDLYVGHPPLSFKDGRPAWRQAAGDTPVNVPAPFLDLNERVLVEARPEGAGLGTVPIDRILIFPAEKLPLLLPPGRYRIDGFLEAGRIQMAPVLVQVK